MINGNLTVETVGYSSYTLEGAAGPNDGSTYTRTFIVQKGHPIYIHIDDVSFSEPLRNSLIDGVHNNLIVVKGPDGIVLTEDEINNIGERYVKHGRTSISGLNTTVTITFTTPFADTNYTPIVTVYRITAGLPIVAPIISTAYTATGFTVEITAAPGLGASYGIAWTAIHDV